MIDLVGYRVNSRKATHFRQWATDVLKEYLVKGFAMDDGGLRTQVEAAAGASFSTASMISARARRCSIGRFSM